MECYCDYDPAEFYRSTIRRAIKKHICDDCGGTIMPGESYEAVAGKWDYVQSFKTCQRCLDLRMWVKNNVPCFCYAHGGLDETAQEAIDDAYYRAADEVVGLRFGYLRRKFLRNRHNARSRL